jgi:hypothetical protein
MAVINEKKMAIEGKRDDSGLMPSHGPKVPSMTLFPSNEKQAIVRSTGPVEYAEFVFSPDRDSIHIDTTL